MQLDAEPVPAGKRLATEVPPLGDSKETLQALLPLLQHRTDPLVPVETQANMEPRLPDLAAVQDAERGPIQPHDLFVRTRRG